MRIDALTVVLRPRSSWEAIELGTALVRRHAAAIWKPWFALTVPVLLVSNLAAWAAGMPALAMLVVWWLKPVFDRIPLFVLSRAVFGEVPGTRATLRGAFAGGPRLHAGYLLWRRLTPVRALVMPVDVLEGGAAHEVAARRRVVAGPAYGVASLAMLVFANFEAFLLLGFAALGVLFVPKEYLQQVAQLLWRSLREAPAWLQLLQGVLAWAAMTVAEPFYVGSGFGLYLNRRTEIEGWDIELAFRRLRARLQAAAGAALVVSLLAVLPHAGFAAVLPAGFSHPLVSPTTTMGSLGAGSARAAGSMPLLRGDGPRSPAPAPVGAATSSSPGGAAGLDSVAGRHSRGSDPSSGPASASASSPASASASAAASAFASTSTPTSAPVSAAAPAPTPSPSALQCPRPRIDEHPLRPVFGAGYRDPAAFSRSVDRAYDGPEIKPRRQVMTWQPRHPSTPSDARPLPGFPAWMARVFASAVEVFMWLLAAGLVLALALTAKHWWPWLRAQVGASAAADGAAQERTVVAAVRLPADLAAAVRRHWAAGDRREALALLYRASVAALEAMRGLELPAGATEAQALRASTALAELPRSVFARVVRSWQYAAYADRWPESTAFDALVTDAASAFGWPR